MDSHPSHRNLESESEAYFVAESSEFDDDTSSSSIRRVQQCDVVSSNGKQTAQNLFGAVATALNGINPDDHIVEIRIDTDRQIVVADCTCEDPIIN